MIDTLEREESTRAAEFRIYVACLASYNNGRLHGAWIDLDNKDESEVWREISAMLAKSPYPNVKRQRCNDCGHYQDARQDDACDECGGELSEPFASAEEWAVHDHEGFGDLVKSEWPDIGELCQIVEFLDGAEDYEARGFRWLIDDLGYSVGDAIDKAGEVCIYEDNAAEYAAELMEDSGQLEGIPENLRYYFDYEALGRDMLLGGDIVSSSDDRGRFIVTNPGDF